MRGHLEVGFEAEKKEATPNCYVERTFKYEWDSVLPHTDLWDKSNMNDFLILILGRFGESSRSAPFAFGQIGA